MPEPTYCRVSKRCKPCEPGLFKMSKSLAKFLKLTYSVLSKILFIDTFLQSFGVKAIGNAEQYYFKDIFLEKLVLLMDIFMILDLFYRF